jgi:hypothetical protein
MALIRGRRRRESREKNVNADSGPPSLPPAPGPTPASAMPGFAAPPALIAYTDVPLLASFCFWRQQLLRAQLVAITV